MAGVISGVIINLWTCLQLDDVRCDYTIALELYNRDGTCPICTKGYSEEYFNKYLPLTVGPRRTGVRKEDLSLTVKSMVEGFSNTLQETVGGVIELEAKITQISKTQTELDEKIQAVCDAEAELKAKEEQLEKELKDNEERLEREREKVEEDRKRLQEEIQRMSEMNTIKETRVKLDVGGHVYTTSTLTLTKDQESMLAAMFSGRHSIQREDDGSYFIDRDGTHFRYILNYLRDGGFNDGALPTDRGILSEILTEAKYYQLDGLVALLLSV